MPLLRLLLIVLISATLGACAARTPTTAGGPTPRPFPGAPLPPRDTPDTPPLPEPPPTVSTEPRDFSLGEPRLLPELVVTALKLRGTPYRWGGSDPSGFDCSGFVQWVFNAVGVRLPRETKDQFRAGDEIDLDEVSPGDLVFFNTENKGASHVGMVIGDGQFVHAPSSRGVVRVESYGSSYWRPRFVGARRVATEGTGATETD
ncbi:MAG: C40 family peptidase [Vicinamibacterales bacterium]